MDDLFAKGNKVWKFFEALLDPARYAEALNNPWIAGPVILLMVVFVALWTKNRKARMERRQRLEELEQALLDEDTEEHSLGLPDQPPEFDADWEDEEITSSTPVLSRGGLVKDPALRNKIVIGPGSERKIGKAASPQPSPDSESSDLEIEAEFVKFAEELNRKQQEVRRRHEIMEVEVQAAPAPLSLDAADMLEEEAEENGLGVASLSDDELDNLLQLDIPDLPEAAWPDDPDEYDHLESEMEETINELSRQVEDPEPESAWAVEPEPDPKIKLNQLVQRLEEFQRDLEHRFQSQTLKSLTERNIELVESMRDPEQTPEFQNNLREKQTALHTLESLMFPHKTGQR